MDAAKTIEIEVAQETAQALRDPRRLQAVGRLVNRLVRARPSEDRIPWGVGEGGCG